MNNPFDKEIHLNLLNLLQKELELTQREMKKRMGVSLGRINYFISALANKCMIKVEKLKKSKNKSAYIYHLTPKGLEEMADLTLSFLKIKINEYNKIKKEIEILSNKIDKIDPFVKKDLKHIS